jgi:hypothetical protein
MDREQWDLLWTGEQAFWRAVPHLLAAGYHTVEELLDTRKQGTGRPYKIPRLMAAQEDERTQTMRLILSRGIRGIDERTRGLTQRWFDMVDWRSAQVGNAKLGVSRSIEGYAKTVESEVSQQHPARTWVERQERKSREYQLGQPPTTSVDNTCCRSSGNRNRGQTRRKDGGKLIQAGTRSKFVEA